MILSFLIFFMMPDGAKKRPAAGNLTPLKQVTKKSRGDLDDTEVEESLKRVIMKDFLAKLDSFNLSLVVEFCKAYSMEVEGTTVREVVKNLIKKGYTNTDLEMTVDNDDVLLSNEIAKFQRGKLEGIFQGKPDVADLTIPTIYDSELNDNNKVGDNLRKVLENQETIVATVAKDLNNVMKRLSLNETDRLLNMLMKCKLELIIFGINLNDTNAKNAYDIGIECKKYIREIANKNLKDELNKNCSNGTEVANNAGVMKIGIIDRAEVRAMGKEPKMDERRKYKTLPVIIKLSSESEKEIVKETLKDPSLMVRESTPKNINDQRNMIQTALRELPNFKDEKIWIKSDMVNIRPGGTPSFMVKTKNSGVQDSKWTTLGQVTIRDPSIWGALSIEVKKEHVYAETNVPVI